MSGELHPIFKGINKVASLLPAQAQPAQREYDGLEYRWKFMVFRPATLKHEAVVVGIVVAYLMLYFVGKWYNTMRMKNAYKPYKPFLSSQFTSLLPAISSGPALHLLYASGRRNLLSLHLTLKLLPLHDVVGMVYAFGKGLIYPTADALGEGLVLDLTLGQGEKGLQGEGMGVWGLLDKGEMRATMEKRWDMTFPRLQQNQSIPITHAVFTEHSDLTDLLLKTPNLGISELVNNTTAARVLKYFLVSDVSSFRPTNGPLPSKLKERHIIVSFIKPSGKNEEQAVQAWMQVALNVADFMAKPNLVKQEVSRKLLRTRQQVDDDLQAAHSKEKAEDAGEDKETAEEKRLAKKKADKRAGLSEKELKRLDELEKKREMRKMQKRQAATGKM